MSAKPWLNCGEPHDHDGIYCSSCRGSDSDLTSGEIDPNGGNGTKQLWEEKEMTDGGYRELEVPVDVYRLISDVVENDVTYRDVVDFLLSAIRLELRQAPAAELHR